MCTELGEQLELAKVEGMSAKVQIGGEFDDNHRTDFLNCPLRGVFKY